MIIRSRTLVSMVDEPRENAAVVVDGGRIVAVGTADEIEAQFGRADLDLGEQVLLPGLINAHCHLDYTMMRKSIRPPKSFAEWIGRINALKRTLELEDFERAIEQGLQESMRWGTTSILNIESYPELLLRIPPPVLRVWWFYELIDLRHRVLDDELMAGALTFFDGKPGWLGGFGLSPHAPYTASAELYRLSATCAEALKMPVTSHVAESREEAAMFRERSGPLHDFLASLGRDMSDCDGQSPFLRLLDDGGLQPDTILVHLNELGEDDFARISQPPLRDRLQVVHCPRSHAYFDHAPFPWQRLRDLGATISLGTDSLASCDSLNLFLEMRQLAETQPWLRPEEILQSVTVNPARALRREGRLGCIAPGAAADFIALPFTGAPSEAYSSILTHEQPIRWMMVNGQIIA